MIGMGMLRYPKFRLGFAGAFHKKSFGGVCFVFLVLCFEKHVSGIFVFFFFFLFLFKKKILSQPLLSHRDQTYRLLLKCPEATTLKKKRKRAPLKL